MHEKFIGSPYLCFVNESYTNSWWNPLIGLPEGPYCNVISGFTVLYFILVIKSSWAINENWRCGILAIWDGRNDSGIRLGQSFHGSLIKRHLRVSWAASKTTYRRAAPANRAEVSGGVAAPLPGTWTREPTARDFTFCTFLAYRAHTEILRYDWSAITQN